MGYITKNMLDLCEVVYLFQSSFELMGYITLPLSLIKYDLLLFQSSFELMGYITDKLNNVKDDVIVSKLFRAYGLYNLCSLEGA